MITVGRFAILGPDEAAPVDALLIRIFPGIGWGAGWHPSTQAILRAMESYGLSGLSVADVGTGVGTLAIAAHLLGAASVLAAEVQPERAKKALANFALNNATIEILVADVLDRDVEVIIANLGATAPTLDAMRHATWGFIVTVDDIDDEFAHETAEKAGFTVEHVERLSNVGPKPEPVPLNYISHVLVGRR